MSFELHIVNWKNLWITPFETYLDLTDNVVMRSSYFPRISLDSRATSWQRNEFVSISYLYMRSWKDNFPLRFHLGYEKVRSPVGKPRFYILFSNGNLHLIEHAILWRFWIKGTYCYIRSIRVRGLSMVCSIFGKLFRFPN